MVGINVLLLVLVVYYLFGGWKCLLFGDLYVYGLDVVWFYMKCKMIM